MRFRSTAASLTLVSLLALTLSAADRRVPTVDDLLTLHVVGSAQMIVDKGFGHGITKPRALRAVMQHNLAWFNHYLWGDPKPDFVAPEVPKRAETKTE